MVLSAHCRDLFRADATAAAECELAPPALPRSAGEGILVQAGIQMAKGQRASAIADALERADRKTRPVPPDQYRSEHSEFENREQARSQCGLFLAQSEFHRQRNYRIRRDQGYGEDRDRAGPGDRDGG